MLVWADSGMKASRKANFLIESLKKNEEKEGLKEMIVEEVIENQDFDYNDKYVVENILSKIEKFMEESLWVRNVKIAKELVNLKQKPEENNKQFVIRFSTFENRLRNNGAVLPNMMKAGLLMNQSKLNKTEKANIMSNIDMNDEKTVLEKVKTKLKIFMKLMTRNQGMTFSLETIKIEAEAEVEETTTSSEETIEMTPRIDLDHFIGAVPGQETIVEEETLRMERENPSKRLEMDSHPRGLTKWKR